MGFNEGVFNCESCNFPIDMDIIASINILKNNISVEGRGYMPMGTKTSTFILECLKSIIHIYSSFVNDKGSFTDLT